MSKLGDPISVAARMGWKHGLHCIGCCWLIMLSLVLGAMNFAWNIALAALAILEEHVPYERWLLRVTGAAFSSGEAR